MFKTLIQLNRKYLGSFIFSRLGRLFEPGFEITKKIVHDSHDFHDKIFVVHDFFGDPTIFDAFFEAK